VEKPEAVLRAALTTMLDVREAAMTSLGQDPNNDPHCHQAKAALAQPPGLAIDSRSVHLSMQGILTSLVTLSEVCIQGVREDNMQKIGDACCGLERATARLLHIGQPGPFVVEKWEDELKRRNANEGNGSTPKSMD
jgi:hypothetical protein